MTESETPTFEPFLALTTTRGQRMPYQTEGVRVGVLVASSPKTTINFMMSAAALRELSVQLNAVADDLDPPVADPGNPPFEPVSPRAQRDKAATAMAKRAARKKSGRKTKG